MSTRVGLVASKSGSSFDESLPGKADALDAVHVLLKMTPVQKVGSVSIAALIGPRTHLIEPAVPGLLLRSTQARASSSPWAPPQRTEDLVCGVCNIILTPLSFDATIATNMQLT